ncbi:MAG: hypothetical protein II047_06185, partial [Bacteroidales bacterium]|nr:hypothetical protein [Bacteroidales bacterium]
FYAKGEDLAPITGDQEYFAVYKTSFTVTFLDPEGEVLQTGLVEEGGQPVYGDGTDPVSEDEKESGLRRILNFGHTMAHAIEQETGYVRYNHGEAVAVGMMGAAHISRDMGLVDEAEVQRAKDLIEALHLPVRAEGCTVENMYASIFHDKKTVNGKVNWVLMESIGSVVVRNDVPEDLVKKAMAKVIDI